jgi:hypothetical protein
MQTFHDDAAVGDNLVGDIYFVALGVGAFPVTGEGFELIESGSGARCRMHFLGSGERGDESAEDESE